jgi:hypothetical protein
MAFTDMVGHWQDHACIPSATHYDTAMLPIAADNDLAHLQMLREVKHRVSNEDEVPPHDPLVAAVHCTCQAHCHNSWIAQCPAVRNTFAEIPAQPSNRILRACFRARAGQRAADLSGSMIAAVVTTRYLRSSWSSHVSRQCDPVPQFCEAYGPLACTVPVLMLVAPAR